ncbi:hypothetical protein SAMN05421770_101299 [Granulicella rosea]|uniref:Uncharacterized protein n=1 Tax=Granulicella rosea TaxID=474952 RepID=A0A239D6N4_9BACT|nr:hypothetical protein [Granulicella rosea]SNS27524.1 hypothetical protein SAMN05421770_101299 [Granulicella rosea]
MNLMCFPKNAAARRYAQRFLPTMALYCLAIFFSTWYFKHYHPAGALAYLLAVLPAIPLVAVIVIVGLYLSEEKDEFQHALLVQSLIWSIGATLAVTTVWGFLEAFLPVLRLQPYLIFPMFCFFSGIAKAVQRWRYR